MSELLQHLLDRRTGALFFLGAFVIWTVFGVIEGSQYYFIRSLGSPVSWEHAFRVAIPRMWVWAALTPAIVAVSKRIAGYGTVQKIVLHLAGAVVFSGLGLTLGVIVYYWTANSAGTPLARLVPAYFSAHSAVAIIAYLAVTGSYYAYSYYDRFRQRDLKASRLQTKASRLEARLSESRLRLLREQLQPHFLFNALHSVSALVLKGESGRAIRMIARLTEFLRLTLDQPPGQLVTLEEEIELLDRYLCIQQERFGDRLNIEWDVEVSALHALVPSLVLQPLVENAVRHGVENRDAGGLIRIAASVSGQRIRIRVEDDGPGIRGIGRPEREGIGLRNTRLRLRELYGASNSALDCRNRPEGGAVAEVVIPFVEADRAPDQGEERNQWTAAARPRQTGGDPTR